MNVEELKKELDQREWLFERSIAKETGISWQAYKKIEGFNYCENDRQPAMICTPYQFFDVDGRHFLSVDFSITGQTSMGLWVKLLVYSVSMDNAIEELPKAEILLRTAWNAISQLNYEQSK